MEGPKYEPASLIKMMLNMLHFKSILLLINHVFVNVPAD